MCKELVHVKKKKNKALCIKIRSSESSLLTIQLRIRVVPLDETNMQLLVRFLLTSIIKMLYIINQESDYNKAFFSLISLINEATTS